MSTLSGLLNRFVFAFWSGWKTNNKLKGDFHESRHRTYRPSGPGHKRTAAGLLQRHPHPSADAKAQLTKKGALRGAHISKGHPMFRKYSRFSMENFIEDSFLVQIMNVIGALNKAFFGILSFLIVLTHNDITDGNVENILGMMTKSMVFGLSLFAFSWLFIGVAWLFSLRDRRSW
jgi:hypothetical protein